MNLSNVLMFLMPAGLGTLVAGASILPGILQARKTNRAYQTEITTADGRKRYQMKLGNDIVKGIPTNNTVPELERTFTNLLADLELKDLELNIDLRGYITNG